MSVSKDKKCCYNCFQEVFFKTNTLSSPQRRCLLGVSSYDQFTNEHNYCQCFLKRSAAYVLKKGTAITVDGKRIKAKEPPYNY